MSKDPKLLAFRALLARVAVEPELAEMFAELVALGAPLDVILALNAAPSAAAPASRRPSRSPGSGAGSE